MNKEAFGKFIADVRRELGMTQQALAERLHVTNTAVSKWERGLSYPDLTLFEGLADALGLTVTELMSCQKQTVADSSEASMRSLLDIAAETKARRRKKIRAAVAILAVTAVIAVCVFCCYLYLPIQAKQVTSFVAKEQTSEGSFVYLERGGKLLCLSCEDPSIYDSVLISSSNAYLVRFRFSRGTSQGVLEACEESSAIGTPLDLAGSTIALEEDLFGFGSISKSIGQVIKDPGRDGKYLYTFSYWRKAVKQSTGKSVDVYLLTVENCRADLLYDHDGDGINELLILTKYDEAPYLLYDLAEGKLITTFLKALPEAVILELQDRAEE